MDRAIYVYTFTYIFHIFITLNKAQIFLKAWKSSSFFFSEYLVWLTAQPPIIRPMRKEITKSGTELLSANENTAQLWPVSRAPHISLTLLFPFMRSFSDNKCSLFTPFKGGGGGGRLFVNFNIFLKVWNLLGFRPSVQRDEKQWVDFDWFFAELFANYRFSKSSGSLWSSDDGIVVEAKGKEMVDVTSHTLFAFLQLFLYELVEFLASIQKLELFQTRPSLPFFIATLSFASKSTLWVSGL